MKTKLTKGDRVTVRNTTPGGIEFIEGVVKLIEFRREVENGELWMVRFSDGDEVLRTVYFDDLIQESKS